MDVLQGAPGVEKEDAELKCLWQVWSPLVCDQQGTLKLEQSNIYNTIPVRYCGDALSVKGCDTHNCPITVAQLEIYCEARQPETSRDLRGCQCGTADMTNHRYTSGPNTH